MAKSVCAPAMAIANLPEVLGLLRIFLSQRSPGTPGREIGRAGDNCLMGAICRGLSQPEPFAIVLVHGYESIELVIRD